MNFKTKHKLSPQFISGLEKLGFGPELDKNLFIAADLDKHKDNPSVWFELEKAGQLGAAAVYFRNAFEGRGAMLPLIYIYDFSSCLNSESVTSDLTEIQRKIWTSGRVPLSCIFFAAEIKILDCTVPINAKKEEPVYLIDKISLVGKAHKIYNEQFANKIKSGVFWDEEKNQKKFAFNNSSYDQLISYLRNKVIPDFIDSRYEEKRDEEKRDEEKRNLAHKLIIQSILIKYLEERESNENGRITKVFDNQFFMQFNGAKSFCDVLRNGNFFKLCEELNQEDKFNGNVFEWSNEDKTSIADYNLSILANALDGNSDIHGQRYFWRQYDFNYVPVELISRLYEEFIINHEAKKEKNKNGKVYTPAHLVKFLVDEAMPLNKSDQYQHTDNYKILDPACGSGIFLVLAFKRLVQWYRLNNEMKKPSSKILQKILSDSIFGVDIDEKATQLTAVSLCLAICDELSPKEIWDDLQFTDLTESNIFRRDFFEWKKEKKEKAEYDLIIGNPPFVRGGVDSKAGFWNLGNQKIKIPQNQICLKFLSESVSLLKDNGLSSLIVKASSLLYNSTSHDFKKALFSNFNIKQILDFTPLARNKSLWDNGDVAASAVFLKNEEPDKKTNILHAVFRRTKASKDRIAFEIDDYDLHFVNRHQAIENDFIWKINLLGGGRIKNVIEKCLEFQNLEKFAEKNQCEADEGFIKGTNGKIPPYNIQYIPTEAVTEDGIDFSRLSDWDANEKYLKVPDELVFTAPNIIIKENIGKNKIPVFFNTDRCFAFKDKLIGLWSKNNDISILKKIYGSFINNNDLYRSYIFCTSPQVLVNKNTASLKEDIMRLPVIPLKLSHELLSEIDQKVISDVNNVMQEFLRKGEKSDAVKPIPLKDNEPVNNFGNEFSRALNLIYEDGRKKFRLAQIIRFTDNKFIGTVFTYNDKEHKPHISKLDYNTENIKELLEFDFSEQLSAKRIIKYYQKNKVTFIKPNQKRYWLSLFAYRDADKTFAELSESGY
jgi:hypothetical protein